MARTPSFSETLNNTIAKMMLESINKAKVYGYDIVEAILIGHEYFIVVERHCNNEQEKQFCPYCGNRIEQ